MNAVLAVAAVSAPQPQSNQTRSAPTVFEAEDYFVLRTPLLPLSALPQAGPGHSAQRRLLQMQELWQRPLVREAIYLASISLHDRLAQWDWQLRSKKDFDLAGALHNYLSRMATRPTPFGLCAAVSVGRVSARNALDIECSQLQRHTRLDTSAVAAVCEQLTQQPELRHLLPLRANDCGHRVGNRWHYVDWLLCQGLRVYTLSSVAASEVLQLVLDAASGPGLCALQLAERICSAHPDVDSAAALGFIDSLVENRLLIAQLQPRLTGSPCLPAMIEQLQALADPGPGLSTLREVERQLQALDDNGPAVEVADYQAIAERLRPLASDLDPKQLFQVDLYRNGGEFQLSVEIAAEIAQAAEMSLRLGAARATMLDDFCRRYNARYEGRRMPLLQVLDPETGIGDADRSADAGDLLAGVGWLGRPAEAADAALEALLLSRWRSAAAHGVEEIELKPDDLPTWDASQVAAVASSAHAVATLYSADPRALNDGDYQILLQGVLGPSAANMVGRFAFGCPELGEHIRASLAAEAASYPDAVLAEIVHLPQERMGNLACRPLLREFEIPLLGSSGATSEQQIDLDDLELEVRGMTVLLWSRRLQRRVIPRMSNAHNYAANPLGLYRFLCMLQYQGHLVGNFRFPETLESLPKLPRVRCGRVILAPARWRIGADEAKELLAAARDQQPAAVRRLRCKRGLPRLLGMLEGDSVQALDLEDPFAIEAFSRALRKHGQLQLIEASFDPAKACVGAGQARYSHEIVLPLRKRPRSEAAPKVSALQRFAPARPPSVADADTRTRDHLPGSDWLYFRLHGSPNTLDRLLSESVAPLAERMRSDGTCTDWFYIRYGDPDWHLRLRLHGQSERLLTLALPQLHRLFDELVRQQQLSRVEIGSYQRELERYGGPQAMALCEHWFAQESRRVAAMLSLLRGGQRHWRWQTAAAVLLTDLRDLGLGEAALLDLFSYLADGFKREFRMENQRLASLGNKYRQSAAAVQAACLGQLPADLPPALDQAIHALVDSEREQRREIGNDLRTLAQTPGSLWSSFDQLLPSLVHMSCNRWFADHPRANEMVLYELIRRGLLAVRARSGKAASG